MITAEKPQVEKASAEDLESARSLLTISDLPTQGLEETELWRVRDKDGRILGIAGLETWGRQGLLRSVVVADARRNEGIGRSLVRRVTEEARERGVRELYLITETAPRFFEKLGFRPLERKRVEGEVLNSVEFKGACAETAPVMLLRLS